MIMEMFTLRTAISLNMTHNASFYAESVNAAEWNTARLVEAKLSCFCWCITALMKSTRLNSFQRDHEKRVWFTSEASIWKYCSGVFCLTETGKEHYIPQELHTLYFEFNRKNTLFAKRVRTNVGRATAKTYNGDRHFCNVRYR